jgi:hypothetical protein
VPLFLDQLVDALRLGSVAGAHLATTAQQHGRDLHRRGCTVAHVVYHYGDVCQAITELAGHSATPLSTDDMHTLNRCLDEAMAGAVTAFGHGRDAALSETSRAASVHLASCAAELRNVLHATVVALAVHRSGDDGAVDRADAVLRRSLLAIPDLIDRVLADVHVARTTAPASITDEVRAPIGPTSGA